MEDLEKKIEEAAESILIAGQINNHVIKRSFILGAKSPEAREFHTQGMYSEEDMRDAFKAGHRLGLYRLGWSGYPNTDNCTQPNLESWMEQHKRDKS